MAITASGIGSGLDIESLVTQLVAAEGQPATVRLARREAEFQADLSSIGVLNSELSSFQSAVKDLQTATDFLSRATTSSDDERFTATANTEAVAGAYQIEISQLAQGARLSSLDFTSEAETVGTGTLDISVGAESFSLTIDATNQTLSGIRDTINNAENNPGVTASILNVDSGTRLVLSSETPGSTNTISITATDDDELDGFDLARLDLANFSGQNASDAIILVDGLQVTRDSNSISDVIQGVTLSLEKAEVGVTETLTVELDKDAVKQKINSFVSAYNSVADAVSQLTAFDAETGASGQFQGDAGIRSLQNQIRQAISDPVSGIDASTLASIGITTSRAGTLVVDLDEIDTALNTDFSAISKLFTNEDGLANRFDTLIDRYVSSEGILSSRSDGLQTQIEGIAEDREDLNLRLELIEARYRSQFSALDSLVNQLNSIGSFLSQQLANLPQIRTSSGN